ncbi:hypothetical protein PsYK624_166950 [Phanerochaete sordida]|uniref:Uncharacterized protein n=1 Tax=Phanerochaete sordida TaxID=48140 RepID=A0A9P3LMB9_9APHY|nr:hypothetical protein PsYK624_166950 [Phanerochaete sordida]
MVYCSSHLAVRLPPSPQDGEPVVLDQDPLCPPRGRSLRQRAPAALCVPPALLGPVFDEEFEEWGGLRYQPGVEEEQGWEQGQEQELERGLVGGCRREHRSNHWGDGVDNAEVPVLLTDPWLDAKPDFTFLALGTLPEASSVRLLSHSSRRCLPSLPADSFDLHEDNTNGDNVTEDNLSFLVLAEGTTRAGLLTYPLTDYVLARIGAHEYVELAYWDLPFHKQAFNVSNSGPANSFTVLGEGEKTTFRFIDSGCAIKNITHNVNLAWLQFTTCSKLYTDSLEAQKWLRKYVKAVRQFFYRLIDYEVVHKWEFGKKVILRY